MSNRRNNPISKRSIELMSIPIDTQIRSLGSNNIEGRVGLLGVVDQLKMTTRKSAEQIRVLELGAGSARLADWLICDEGIQPPNYVISDNTYGTNKAPALQRRIHDSVRRGVMRALPLDIFEKPVDIGKFDLIAMSFVLGTPKFLMALLNHYYAQLNSGGVMIATSAQYSYAQIQALIQKIGQNPFLTFEQLSDDEKITFNLLSRLNDLKDRGEIKHYINAGQMFHTNASVHPSLTFILNKLK